MIARLKIKNWRSHHESEFKFAKGVNVLIGIMGSGKSSVMDALCYALFGTFPALQQRKLKLDDILRDKPNQAISASVELDFVKDEAVYTVYREIALEKGTRNVELRKNGVLLEAENSQAVTEYVEKILHLDYDIFSRAVYAEQNQLDYFLELPKGQRMAQIDSLLKINTYEDARKTVTSLANKIDAERETKEYDSKALFSAADESTIARLGAEISDTQKEAARLEAERINAENLLEQTRESLEKARAARESKAEIERLESESRGLESTLEILDHELKLIAKKLAENNKDGADAEKETLNKLVEKFGNSKELSAKLKETKEQEISFEKRIERAETKKEYLGHALKDIGESDNCPLCKSHLDPAKKSKLKEGHAHEISALESEIKELKEKLRETQKSYFETESAHEQIAVLETEVATAEESAKIALQIGQDFASRERELSAKRGEIDAKLKALASRKSELEKEKEEDADIKKLEADYENVLVATEKTKGRLSSLSLLKAEKAERLAILEEKRKVFTVAVKEVESLSRIKRSLEIFSGALLKTQEELRAEFITIVNEVMAEIWPTLYPYGDFTNVKLMIENRDYVLKARTTSEWVNVEGITSGGERSLAALALRIAFSLALARNLGMLVLDEPTHNLDTNAVDELAITLRERLPNLIDQIFLITHEERLESAVSGYLYRLERNKELDEPTKVVLIASPEL